MECVNLNDDVKREEMMFRVMFNTAFIRSNILILNRDEIDMLWNAKDQFSKDFRVEVFHIPDLFRCSYLLVLFLNMKFMIGYHLDEDSLLRDGCCCFHSGG